MGWLIYNDRRIKCYADEKAEIARLCTFETETQKSTLVKACKVGSTWYAAVRTEPVNGEPIKQETFETETDGSYTFGAVFLTRYDDGCWGYKDMDEGQGPCEAQAPLSLIDLLSKIKDPKSHAHNWRKRCRAWAAIPSYNEGDKIKLAAPVTLTDGSTCQIVTATHYLRRGKQRRCYRIEETGGLVRLSKASLAGSELLESAQAAASPVLAEFFALQGR